MQSEVPTLEKYTFKYWTDELKGSKQDRSSFEEIASRSIKVYKKEHKLQDCEREIGIWWSLVNTLMPAYFSRVPKVDVEQRKKKGREEYRLAGLAWEAGTQYAIEEHFNFESIGHQSVLQYLLTGHGILWARYEADFEQKEYEYALKHDEDYDGQGEQEEREGVRYVKEQIEEKAKERAILDAINYKDYRCSRARNDEEVTWKARRSYLTRERAYALFGEDKARTFNYNSYPEEKNTEDKEKKDYEGCAEVWEIWCKTTKSVYWLHQGKDKFLEKAEPPVDYVDFWPCVEIKANFEPHSVVPFSDYKICEDLIIEIERLTTRIHATIQAIRANFAYNQTLGEAMEKLLEGDLEGIPVNLSTSSGKLANEIWFMEVKPYIDSLGVLTQSREQALQKLYEITAASDLIRGVTAPVETATAQQLKSNFSNLRFSVRREQVARFLTAGIKKIGEIIVEKFDDQTIYDMSFGEDIANEIPDPPAPPQPEGQPPLPPIKIPPFEKFQLILGVLRDDTMRNFKLDIESDSIVELDQRADRAERIDAITSVGSFMNQMEPYITKYPSGAAFAEYMIKFVIRSYKAGKDIEGGALGQFRAMVQEIANQPKDQDPKAGDNAAKVQIAQIKSQSDQQKVAADMQKTHMEIQAQKENSFVDYQIAMMDARNKELESRIKLMELNATMQEIRQAAAASENEQIIKLIDSQQSRYETQAGLIKERMDTEQELIKANARQMQSSGVQRNGSQSQV